MARPSIIAALLGIASIAAPPLSADEPSLKDVLRRMSAYVQAYGEKASIVVATERYTQHVNAVRPTSMEHRVTVADFAIVKAEGLGGWVGFRDVVEVDGARVTDHQDRLLQVLSASSGMDEARRLSDESARFNIGPILRNFNVPTTALFFFRPENLDRFKFTRKSAGQDGTWEIAFRETDRPTLIRTPEGGSVPSEGSVWVSAADGTVVRTRMRMTAFGAPGAVNVRGSGSAQIDVTYRRVAALDMWLPETMTESYEGSRGPAWDRTTTEARYTDYRQFQTSVRIK
jgi:hypothetical protein